MTDVELARLLGVDRRTACKYRLKYFSEMRRGWLHSLSEVAIREFLKDGWVAAVAPFTFSLKELPPAVTVVGGCERRFAGVPTVGELGAFCEHVYTTLFGRRGAVLALQRDAEGSTTAAVVVPARPGASAARDHNDDRYALAA